MSIWCNVQLVDEYFLPREKLHPILFFEEKKKDWNATGSMILTSESVTITVDEKGPVGCNGSELYPWSPAVLSNFSVGFIWLLDKTGLLLSLLSTKQSSSYFSTKTRTPFSN